MSVIKLTDDSIPPETAGSGGGPTDPHTHPDYHDGVYSLSANQIQVTTRPPMPPLIPEPSVITILATNLIPTDGRIDMRGQKAVRITTGPPALPPTTDSSTNGIEMIASEAQKVTIQRGLIDGVDQKISMDIGSITIDGGAGTITIQSMTEIVLQVAGGTSSIKLTPTGIQISGPMIQVQGALVQIN